MNNKYSTLLVLVILALVGLGCSWLPAFIGDRGKHMASYALSPDNKQIAISANDGDLYLLDLDSKKVTRLTENARLRENVPRSRPTANRSYMSQSRPAINSAAASSLCRSIPAKSHSLPKTTGYAITTRIIRATASG